MQRFTTPRAYPPATFFCFAYIRGLSSVIVGEQLNHIHMQRLIGAIFALHRDKLMANMTLYRHYLLANA